MRFRVQVFGLGCRFLGLWFMVLGFGFRVFRALSSLEGKSHGNTDFYGLFASCHISDPCFGFRYKITLIPKS